MVNESLPSGCLEALCCAPWGGGGTAIHPLGNLETGDIVDENRGESSSA